MRSPIARVRWLPVGSLASMPAIALVDLPETELELVVADWPDRKLGLARLELAGQRAALVLFNVPPAAGLITGGKGRIALLPAARDPGHQEELLALAVRALVAGIAISVGSGATAPAKKISLGSRERQILVLLADGKANKEIAYDLGISEGTVKFHLGEMFAKLGASNRAQAVRRGMEIGLLSM